MVFVLKHSGEIEQFDPSKVEYALLRAGASGELAAELASEVEERIYDGMSTGAVYRLAFKLLSRRDTSSATRFGLKLSIMRLGPTGFPFEKYVARILDRYGYKTQINQMLAGRCAEHEVDVVAEKGGERFMVECKYHNQQGLSTGLKEALYTWARFEDLADAGHRFSAPWIVCNTKCTLAAIGYGECKGMNVTSWGYPAKGSLQDLVEDKHLYPVTILRRLTNDMKNRLIDSGFVLVEDLAGVAPRRLSEAAGISQKKLSPLIKELGEISAKQKRD